MPAIRILPADAPDNVIRMVISGAAHGSLPSLRSYVKHPFVTESEIVLTPGYHQETGTFAEFDPSDYGGIPATPSDDEIVQAMVANPILIERPIVINGDKAVIARPLEKAAAIL